MAWIQFLEISCEIDHTSDSALALRIIYGTAVFRFGLAVLLRTTFVQIISFTIILAPILTVLVITGSCREDNVSANVLLYLYEAWRDVSSEKDATIAPMLDNAQDPK